MNVRITVIGAGYVGLSIAILLSQHNDVTVTDIDEEKVDMINRREPPIQDEGIALFFKNHELRLFATTDLLQACSGAEWIIAAVPTDYKNDLNAFDTSILDAVLSEAASFSRDAVLIIKSTIPVGYTKSLRERFPERVILFNPEFLRETHALFDSLRPNRIIVGTDLGDTASLDAANRFSSILEEGTELENTSILIMQDSEAECVKLFSNAYLALRVSFFNELDTFAEARGMDARQIIEGVCLDPRIGMFYNNPSFGYGGYCLPKDTKQLLANYENIPEQLIEAIVRSNQTRKDYVANRIQTLALEKSKGHPCVVGIYRLIMKSGSDNYRNSSMLGIIKRLRQKGIDLVIYEPSIDGERFMDLPVCNDLSEFKKRASLVVTNRFDKALTDIQEKVYTRDLFSRD